MTTFTLFNISSQPALKWMAKLSLGLSLTILLPNAGLFAQCAAPVVCPRQEVMAFLRWNFSGVLLRQKTEDQAFNRQTAGRFFLSYDDAFPKQMVITVISMRDYSVDDSSIDGKSAQIYFGFWPFGDIDGALRWHPPNTTVS